MDRAQVLDVNQQLLAALLGEEVDDASMV